MKLFQKYIKKYKSKIKKGKVIVISAPSGTGKTTICKELLKRNPKIVFSVSYTTRARRENEVNGKDYFFVSKEKFFKMVKEKKFIEWAEVYGNYYGTPKEQLLKYINSGKDVLLDIDGQGAKNIKKFFPEGVFIFLLPPSFKVLKQRIKSRGVSDEQEVKKRLKEAQKELKYIGIYDYVLINEKLKETIHAIEKIIYANKFKMNLKR